MHKEPPKPKGRITEKLYSPPVQYFTLPGLFHVESMEWGVDSMEWGMDFMEWWMDSILLVDGFHGMGDGFHTFSRWIPYIFQMDSILLPYGIQVE